jgi:hypothetical protein
MSIEDFFSSLIRFSPDLTRFNVALGGIYEDFKLDHFLQFLQQKLELTLGEDNH